MSKRDEKYDVYMICPVRKATAEEKAYLESYRDCLESQGLKVCYPAESTNQEDKGGYNICHDHSWEIRNSKEIHVYWNNESRGSYVDFGAALLRHFTEGINVRLINRSEVEKIVDVYEEEGVTKSYEHVLLKLDDLAE